MVCCRLPLVLELQQWQLLDCGGFLFERAVLWLLRGQLPDCKIIEETAATRAAQLLRVVLEVAPESSSWILFPQPSWQSYKPLNIPCDKCLPAEQARVKSVLCIWSLVDSISACTKLTSLSSPQTRHHSYVLHLWDYVSFALPFFPISHPINICPIRPILWSQPSSHLHYSPHPLTHIFDPVFLPTNPSLDSNNNPPLFLEVTVIMIIYTALTCYALFRYLLI